MMRTWRNVLVVAAFLIPTVVLSAQEPIKFARHPDISPDGKLITFSYLGDVWTVETIGGVARPVTMHQAHDAYPVFSPDGRSIAFSSNRHGSYDVFVVSALGGKPKRLTFDSAQDLVNGWTPDGKHILFQSTRSTEFPQSYELYTVPVEGGRQVRISVNEGRDGTVSPQGDKIAYVRGPGTWYRKGYRGSSNDDIWISNIDGSNNRRLTTFNGQDGSPMWSADGKFIYYVSEIGGTPANLVRQDAEGKTAPVPITFHKDDSVRRARISRNGEWIAYECGGDIWVASTRSGTPTRKVAIEVHADDKTNSEESRLFTAGMTAYSLSSDEKHVAFVVHGSLFLMPIEGGKAKRLTETPAFDHSPYWSPDGQKIVFISDRGATDAERGKHDDVYVVESNDSEHPKLAEAHSFKTIRLTSTPEPESGVSFLPDGKRIAFLRNGQLWTMNPDGTDQKIVVKDKQVIDYEYTSDGKWLAYAREDGSFASEVYVMPAAGGEAKNVTHYATYNSDITWSRDGKKLCFISQRPRVPGAFVMSMQKPAASGAASTSDIDFDDIQLRVEQPSLTPTSEASISPDGTKVAYVADDGDLWVTSVPRGGVSRLTTGRLRPTQIQWKKNGSAIFFRDGTGQLRSVSPSGGGLEALLNPGSRSAGNEARVIGFSVKMTVKRDEEFLEMYDQSWRALAEQFYDPKFHGADWYAVRDKYRALVKHVAMKEDLYSVISLMMGELNASHLGIMGAGSIPDEQTADLGLIFDETYRGPGLKIAEILKRGPADKRGLTLRPGEFLFSIDGERIIESTDVSKLLNGKVGETVAVQVTSNPNADPRDPKAFRRVELQAVNRGLISDLMYDRWVRHNAERVDELSKGKLGYIHIPSMDDVGLDRFMRALYSDNFDKEAIILDVRFNGGGFTHDQVLNYLGAHEHTFFRQRYGGEGLVLRSTDRKWTKPTALLINNRSYSDAEIFPSAFKTLGLGKVIGQPTGGYVIGTSSIRLIDGSIFRTPRIGVYTLKGDNMDKVGVTPDVFVENNPDQLAKGIDAQLDKAVEVLNLDVVSWKKTHSVVSKPEETKPAPVPMPESTPGAGMK